MANKNAVSGVEYKGGNQELLIAARIANPHFSDEWLTYIQARQAGRKVRKGETGTKLVRVIDKEVVKKKTGKKEQEFAVTHFTVFNLMQTEKIEK